MKAAMFAAAVLALSSGCATIFAPGPDRIPVDSNPESTVFLDGVKMGATPTVVSVPRNSYGVFTFEAKGYKTAKVDRDKVLNGMFLIDFVGLIVVWPVLVVGVPVDLICHNQGLYQEKPIFVQLIPEGDWDRLEKKGFSAAQTITSPPPAP